MKTLEFDPIPRVRERNRFFRRKKNEPRECGVNGQSHHRYHTSMVYKQIPRFAEFATPFMRDENSRVRSDPASAGEEQVFPQEKE